MASSKFLHCLGAWLAERQPDKSKTAEHPAWCRAASSVCCLGRLSAPLRQQLDYPVQRLRAKLAEEQAAKQRALCLAAQAERVGLQQHLARQLLEGQERVRVELTTRFAFGLKEIQDLVTTLQHAAPAAGYIRGSKRLRQAVAVNDEYRQGLATRLDGKLQCLLQQPAKIRRQTPALQYEGWL